MHFASFVSIDKGSRLPGRDPAKRNGELPYAAGCEGGKRATIRNYAVAAGLAEATVLMGRRANEYLYLASIDLSRQLHCRGLSHKASPYP